jgi:hypothetical protein
MMVPIPPAEMNSRAIKSEITTFLLVDRVLDPSRKGSRSFMGAEPRSFSEKSR